MIFCSYVTRNEVDLREMAGAIAIHFQAGHLVCLALSANLRIVVLCQCVPFVKLTRLYAVRHVIRSQNPEFSHRHAGHAFEFTHRHRDPIERVGTVRARKLKPGIRFGNLGHGAFATLPTALGKLALSTISRDFRIRQGQLVDGQQGIEIGGRELDGHFRSFPVKHRIAVGDLDTALLVAYEALIIEQGLPQCNGGIGIVVIQLLGQIDHGRRSVASGLRVRACNRNVRQQTGQTYVIVVLAGFPLVAGGPEGRIVLPGRLIRVQQACAEYPRSHQRQRAAGQPGSPFSHAHSSVNAGFARSSSGLTI